MNYTENVLFINLSVFHHMLYFWSQLCLELHPFNDFDGLSLSHVNVVALEKDVVFSRTTALTIRKYWIW